MPLKLLVAARRRDGQKRERGSATSIVRIDLLISPLLAATLEAGAANPKLPQDSLRGATIDDLQAGNPPLGQRV